MPLRSDMPSTIRRSGYYAQHSWDTVQDSAIQSSGQGERAHRTSFAAVRYAHESGADRAEPRQDAHRSGSVEPASGRDADRRNGRADGGRSQAS